MGAIRTAGLIVIVHAAVIALWRLHTALVDLPGVRVALVALGGLAVLGLVGKPVWRRLAALDALVTGLGCALVGLNAELFEVVAPSFDGFLMATALLVPVGLAMCFLELTTCCRSR